MADNNFAGVIESLMKGMNAVLSTKTVVGEATQIGDTIILPLVDVTFGVGAGASAADKKNGGGGGFSAKMSPSAVLVIKNGTTKLVNIKNQDTIHISFQGVEIAMYVWLNGQFVGYAEDSFTPSNSFP